MKTCLVISYGPVPTPEFQTVEGGGMRAWGLAKGLLANGIDVSVAVNDSFPQTLTEFERVKLTNWSLDDNFIAYFNSFDSVIISYCMGDPSVFVADNIAPGVQLLLDVYVPIYVEVSARDAKDMPTEYSAYSQDIARHNKVLKRGDYFLCANQVQKIFYTGVLGSLGVVNPLSYRQDRVKVVPFGIHAEKEKATTDPYTELGIKKDDKRVLWFGGLYPWFRVEELLSAIKKLSNSDKNFKFTLVGGKNPFNNNPDLLRQYEIAIKFAKENNLFNKQMFFIDWVDYDSRINWYENADFVISINQPGEENIFAWRTRVMDYIWGDLVSVTNGGDPLGDELLSEGAALKLPSLNSETIVNTVNNIYKDKAVLINAKKALEKVKQRYIWNHVTESVAKIINDGNLMYSKEQEFILTNNIEISSVNSVGVDHESKENLLKKHIRNSRKIISYAKRKGIKKSAKLGADILKNQLVRKTINPRKFIFISHPIDNTGAPLVLLQIIDEVIEKFGPKNVRIIAPYVDKEILKKLKAKGVSVEKAAEMSYRLAAAQLALSKNDFVLMNTVAVYDCYREVIFNMLNLNRLENAHWFIHEDEAQLKVVKGVIEQKHVSKKISKLVNSDKLLIFVPAVRVKKFYDKLFETEKVSAIPLQLGVPESLQAPRKINDFKTLNFYISGTARDGRKGQLIALSAFQAFRLKYYDKNPENYRDFSLTLVAIGDDYVSSQIKTIGKSVLDEKLIVYPSIPRAEGLEIASKRNVVICCSLNETFGLYIAEGMLMGHIVLRNDSAGMEEQLSEGKNGYFIDSENINQIAETLEKVLNKKTSPDSKLLSMSKHSMIMMKEYKDNRYLGHFKF